jgi:hypothetical protein
MKVGNLRQQKERRKHCKPFSWFMNNIWPELFRYRDKNITSGSIVANQSINQPIVVHVYHMLNFNHQSLNPIDHVTFISTCTKFNMLVLVLWCFTPLSTIFQLYRGGQCDQLYRGGQCDWWRNKNQGTQRKPLTCCKALTNFIT